MIRAELTEDDVDALIVGARAGLQTGIPDERALRVALQKLADAREAHRNQAKADGTTDGLQEGSDDGGKIHNE